MDFSRSSRQSLLDDSIRGEARPGPVRLLRTKAGAPFFAVLALASSVLGGVQVTRLRCEYLTNPLGIDIARPRLGWVLEPIDIGERGHRQTGIIFVRVPGGTFLMGSPGDEEGREQWELQHEVILSPFVIAKYEVTQAE